MLHTDLLPFPSLAKKTSFPNLVTVRSARHTAPPSQIWSLLETPPLVWIMNEDEEEKKNLSIGFMLGRQWRRDIWPHLLLHGTHNSDVNSLSLVITEQDIKTHQ